MKECLYTSSHISTIMTKKRKIKINDVLEFPNNTELLVWGQMGILVNSNPTKKKQKRGK